MAVVVGGIGVTAVMLSLRRMVERRAAGALSPRRVAVLWAARHASEFLTLDAAVAAAATWVPRKDGGEWVPGRLRAVVEALVTGAASHLLHGARDRHPCTLPAAGYQGSQPGSTLRSSHSWPQSIAVSLEQGLHTPHPPPPKRSHPLSTNLHRSGDPWLTLELFQTQPSPVQECKLEAGLESGSRVSSLGKGLSKAGDGDDDSTEGSGALQQRTPPPAPPKSGAWTLAGPRVPRPLAPAHMGPLYLAALHILTFFGGFVGLMLGWSWLPEAQTALATKQVTKPFVTTISWRVRGVASGVLRP